MRIGPEKMVMAQSKTKMSVRLSREEQKCIEQHEKKEETSSINPGPKIRNTVAGWRIITIMAEL